MTIVILRWIRLLLSFCFFCFCLFIAINHQTSLYLLRQAAGQAGVLMNTCSIEEFEKENQLSTTESENLLLIQQIKNYSVDSLGFTPTNNFTSVFNQHEEPILWVITACAPYAFKNFEWYFPIVGSVSYKGFFKKQLAEKEYNHLRAAGYDVDLRSVSAWSTLGWFKDPILSTALSRKKGSFCNLLFHELFHATFYAPGSVDLNENLANFVANKATLLFLRNDPERLIEYQQDQQDQRVYSAYMLRKKNELNQYYKTIQADSNKQALKYLALIRLSDSIGLLPFYNKNKFIKRRKEILKFQNAYFVDFQQYESQQDSLENVFNKIYRADLKKLVSDLE
jgi:predicted aminopeptidase